MLESIYINHFKCIDSISIDFNKDFNVIMGENNIGKTTVFDAIHLWKMCYDINIKKDKKGFYNTAKNLMFNDMEYIRVNHDRELVNDLYTQSPITIALKIEYENQVYDLGFRIDLVTTINDSYLRLTYFIPEEFERFSKMVEGIPGKNLSTFISISESRPVTNILPKEPYLYKAQIRSKINSGKGYEVLRNKIIDNIPAVQDHINNVMKTNYKIVETDKDNKDYINLKVDGRDVVSFGSGFLQLAEIFSSIEYQNAEIQILLIDEPDAHLHLKLQRELIKEFRTLSNSQVFVISHNERFLEEVQDEEIIYISEESKQIEHIEPLKSGGKLIALEGLTGCISELDKLKMAKRLILVEGYEDKDFVEGLLKRYENAVNREYEIPPYAVVPIDGIDKLYTKLQSYYKTLSQIVPSDCKWILLRDTDCIPVNLRERAVANIKKSSGIPEGKFTVIMEDGYELYSTFFSDKYSLSTLLEYYYELSEDSEVYLSVGSLENIVSFLLNIYIDSFKEECLCGGESELLENYNRQYSNREETIYNSFSFTDFINSVPLENVQYFMTKTQINEFFYNFDFELRGCGYEGGKSELQLSDLKSVYFSMLDDFENTDFWYPAHLDLLKEICM